jgi:membrane protease subunit HflK
MSEELHDHEQPAPEGSNFAKAKHVLAGFLILSLIVWLLSGFYRVGTGQVAIVERLGQYLGETDAGIATVENGLHYHLPWPIDRVTILSTTNRYNLQVSEFNTSPATYADFKRDMTRKGFDPGFLNAIYDPYVVTADKSIVHVELAIQFTISDPAAWMRAVSHEYSQDYDSSTASDMRNSLFQQIAQRTIVSQVSRMTLYQVLVEKRAELERNILRAFREALLVPDLADPTGKRKINMGVEVQTVTLSKTEVPDAVKPAYANLVTQLSRADAVRSSADADAKGYIINAQGQTSTLKTQAESYAQTTVQTARGEAERFGQVYTQYKNAPQLSRINLWIDTARTVYGSVKRIYFVQPGGGIRITVDPPQFDTNQVKPAGSP